MTKKIGLRGVMRRAVAVALAGVGCAMAALGAQLAWLGGAVYYAPAGLALIACALLLWREYHRGIVAYGLFCAATTAWALWEAGLDGWALLPRLGLFAVVGLLLLLLKPSRSAATPAPDATSHGRAVAAAIAGLGLLWAIPWAGLLPAPVDAAAGGGMNTATDWASFGSGEGGGRFADARQLHPGNVQELVPAWTYKLPDDPRRQGTGFEAVPLKIGNRLYFCASFNHVFALDAESGQAIWHHSDEVRSSGISRGECRGVAYFRAPQPLPQCTERILYNTLDARLVALDAHDGKKCRDFGNGGEVDLLAGMGRVIPGYYYASSPPQIVRGKAVVNGRVADGQFVGEPSGVIRAFDAITGKFAWAYDIGRPDAHGEPPAGQSYTRGTPNSWGPMSADETLGLVFLPVGNATPDYYSRHRSDFDNAAASSVLALDAETGARRWSFQTTHLDIWDYDVAAQPVLTDFGGTPALVQATKRGEIFILDRRTGRPLTRVVERKTPASTVPGERAAPTQPFSIGFPSVAGPELTERMMWGITPLDQLLCRIAFRQSRYEGPMTPLDRDRFSIVYPGYAGGVNWGSVSIDTGRQIMLVSAMRLANRNRLLTRAEVERQGIEVQMPGKPDLRGGPAPQVGTPYGAEIAAFLSPLGIPCQQPPFGTLTAIDMRSRKALWTIPLGTAERLGPLGVPSHIPVRIGTPLMGGAMTTAGGLTFVGATADRWLRAVDTRSGRILWRGRLPEAGQSVPISYVSQASGRQFVVVAAGGLLGSTGKSGDYLVAFALPRGGQ